MDLIIAAFGGRSLSLLLLDEKVSEAQRECSGACAFVTELATGTTRRVEATSKVWMDGRHTGGMVLARTGTASSSKSGEEKEESESEKGDRGRAGERGGGDNGDDCVDGDDGEFGRGR